MAIKARTLYSSCIVHAVLEFTATRSGVDNAQSSVNIIPAQVLLIVRTLNPACSTTSANS